MKNTLWLINSLFIFFVVLLSVTASARAPDTLWTKTFGGSNHERGLTVQETTDGGYITAGWTESFGAGDHYLISGKDQQRGRHAAD